MSKELCEALERVKKSHYTAIAVMGCERDIETEKALDTIEKGLQRLEAIDNAKPSEALEIVDKIDNHLKYEWYQHKFLDLDISFGIIKQALQRLEAIENANPSEALEKLLDGYSKGMAGRSYYDIIKQYILKAQEMEKLLSILKEKRIDLDLFYSFLKKGLSYEVYFANYSTYGDGLLSKEEFESLRSWLGCQKD